MRKIELKEYRIWKAMKSRCYSPCHKNSIYQKNHIQVCDRWRNSFDNFYKDMGKIPSDDYSIERIDFLGDYCPENCKWLLQSEQAKNRSNVIFITYNNKTQSLKEWARELNIDYDRLRGRVVKRKMPFEKAIQEDPYNRLVEINGEKKTVTEWCKVYNLKPTVAFDRIHRGWDKVKAITTPIKNL